MQASDTAQCIAISVGSLDDTERGQVVAMAAPLHYRHSVKVMLNSEPSGAAAKPQGQESAGTPESAPREKPRVVVYSRSPEPPLDLCQEEWPTPEQADVLERLELMRTTPLIPRQVKPMVIVYSQNRRRSAQPSYKRRPLPHVATSSQQKSASAPQQKGTFPQTTTEVAEAGESSKSVPSTTSERNRMEVK